MCRRPVAVPALLPPLAEVHVLDHCSDAVHVRPGRHLQAAVDDNDDNEYDIYDNDNDDDDTCS